MKVTCIFSLKNKIHQLKCLTATIFTHSYHENNNSSLQKSHHVDATFSIKLTNAAWTSTPNLHVQPGNSPSKENSWAPSCFFFFFKPPANPSKITFPFSNVSHLFLSLLLLYSLSGCRSLKDAKNPPSTLLFITPAEYPHPKFPKPLSIFSLSLWSSFLVAAPTNGLSTGRRCATLLLRVTIWTFLWAGPYPPGNKMKGVMGGTCYKCTGDTEGCLGIPSGVNLNGMGICWSEVYPMEFESIYKLIGWGASLSHPIINISPLRTQSNVLLLWVEVLLWYLEWGAGLWSHQVIPSQLSLD